MESLEQEVGLEEEARLAYQAALERNPESGEAWLPQARLLASHAATLEEQAKQTRGSKRRELLKQHQAALDEAVDLVHRARDAAGSEPDRDLLETLISVYESAGTGDVEAVRQSLQSLDE